MRKREAVLPTCDCRSVEWMICVTEASIFPLRRGGRRRSTASGAVWIDEVRDVLLRLPNLGRSALKPPRHPAGTAHGAQALPSRPGDGGAKVCAEYQRDVDEIPEGAFGDCQHGDMSVATNLKGVAVKILVVPEHTPETRTDQADAARSGAPVLCDLHVRRLVSDRRRDGQAACASRDPSRADSQARPPVVGRDTVAEGRQRRGDVLARERRFGKLHHK